MFVAIATAMNEEKTLFSLLYFVRHYSFEASCSTIEREIGRTMGTKTIFRNRTYHRKIVEFQKYHIFQSAYMSYLKVEFN